MARLVSAFLLCLLGTLPLLAQTPVQEQPKTLDQQRFRAQINKDSTALRRLLADDLIYTHSSGLAETKAAFIGRILSGQLTYQTAEVESLQVRVFGPTAILTGRARIGLLTDGKTNSLYLADTDVWHQLANQT